MSWEYSDNEYLKLYRKMVRWEWYTDVNTFKLFLHCLIKANWRDGSWRGIKYKRGQFITSFPSLAKETGLTIREIRTALAHLKATGEVTDKKIHKGRIITVVNYDEYQGSDRQNDRQNDTQSDRQTTGKRQASDSRYKNNKNNKELQEEKNIYKASPEEIDDDFEDYLDNFREMMRYDE